MVMTKLSLKAFHMALVVKNPLAIMSHWQGIIRNRFSPRVRKIPWRRAWQPAPVFLPGKFRGQRSLPSYSPQGHKESDTTEHTP